MSGKRQHFIPQFIQNNFSSHVNGDEFFTWVYRKNNDPFNTNIRNIGVEGYFYSTKNDTQVDDEITSIEHKFIPLIDNLQRTTDAVILNTEPIAELIAHLEIRTRNFRMSFANMGEIALNELIEVINKTDFFANLIKQRIQNNPTLLHAGIAKELRKFNYSEDVLQNLLAQSSQFLNKIPDSVFKIPQKIQDDLPRIIKELSKNGHISALKQTISPNIKMEIYGGLIYRVLNIKETILPLGDSVVIFQINGNKKFSTFCDKEDILQAVYFPLSPNCILVGSKSDTEKLNIHEIQKAIAKCSLEYFIGSSDTKFNHIHSNIGECANLLSMEEIHALINETLDKLMHTPHLIFGSDESFM